MSDLISRQDTIDRINEYIEEYSEIDSDGNHSEKWCTMQEAKMTIENMPSAQPEKRTEKRTETHACDLIDREAAVDAIYHHLPSVSRTRARTMLHEVPSAQPEQKAGTWKEFHGNKNMCICQSCGFMVNKSLLYDYTEKDPLVFKYCPSCGSYNGGAKTEKCYEIAIIAYH